jgi:hypothetical protein
MVHYNLCVMRGLLINSLCMKHFILLFENRSTLMYIVLKLLRVYQVHSLATFGLVNFDEVMPHPPCSTTYYRTNPPPSIPPHSNIHHLILQ